MTTMTSERQNLNDKKILYPNFCGGLQGSPEHDRDTVSRPDEMKKIGGKVIFSGEGAKDPKNLWVAKTRFFDRMLQKNENWKKRFFGGSQPTLPQN